MTTDMIARDVLQDVREACEKSGRPTTAAEVERALDGLSRREIDEVRRIARGRLDAKPLSPDALVDMARGIPAQVAAARELGGYYAMKAERDALAHIARHAEAESEDEDTGDEESEGDELVEEEDDSGEQSEERADDLSDDEEASDEAAGEFEEAGEAPAPPDALAGQRVKLRKPINPKERGPETEALMTLFAYHRDAVRVAQEMNISLADLSDRVEQLGLRRRIHRMLETTTDIDVFSPERVNVYKGTAQQAPVVRKKGDKPAAAPLPSAPTFDDRERDREPAARTEPVNQHGTRVYRRTEARPESTPPPAGANGRREYVRETKKKPKVSLPKPVREPPKVELRPTPAKRPFSELQGAAGKSVLERLIADEKANPRVLAAKLGERYDGPGRELSEGDLRQLLGHHGLSATFHEREIANTRFLIGFHQGAKAKLSNALQMSLGEVASYLGKLGLSEDLEHTRAERAKLELGRKRIADRLVQVLTRAPYLDDLGVLGVIDREVREHIAKLFADREPKGGSPAQVAEDVRAELGVEPNAFAKLLRRYEMNGKLGA